MNVNLKPMTPDQIKAGLQEKNITVAGIARDLNISHNAIRLVILGDSVSHKIRSHIAECLNKPVDSVFFVKPNPTKKGRPVTHGLYTNGDKKFAA